MNETGGKNSSRLKKDQLSYVRRLNDLYIEAQLSVQGLNSVLGEVKNLQKKGKKRFKISAPSTTKSPRNIYREFALVHELLDQRIHSKEYVQTIVFAVALTESYLSFCLQAVIRAYPQKLLVSGKGTEVKEGAPLPVDLRDIIQANSIDIIIADRASQRVREASYATPESFFKYCSTIFGFEYVSELQKQYIEIKAGRDIFVHNNGIVNKIYLDKSKERSRAQNGQLLPVDLIYLEKTVICLKKLVGETYRGLKSKYGDSDELYRILSQDN